MFFIISNNVKKKKHLAYIYLPYAFVGKRTELNFAVLE